MKNFKRVLSLALAALMVIGGLAIAPADASAATTYTKATSAADILGKDIVLVAEMEGKYYAADSIVSNWLTVKEVTVENGTLTTADAPTVSFTGTKDEAILKDSTGAEVKIDGNKLTQGTGTTWKITAEDGKLLFSVNEQTDARYLALNKNSGDPKFRNYKETTFSNSSYGAAYCYKFDVYVAGEGSGAGSGEGSGAGSGETPSNPSEGAGMTMAEILDAAYALNPGESLSDKVTLKGEVVGINTAYSTQFMNITVTIMVEGKSDKLIECYRLKGTGAENIEVDDTITVTGTIKNYNGKIEFDTGCTLDSLEKATNPKADPIVPENATQEQIVDKAYELAMGHGFAAQYTLSGKVITIDTAYDEEYGNVTVTIQVGDKADKLIKCFRMKGTGIADIVVGDEIKVKGYLKNWLGEIEFDAGCTFEGLVTEDEGGNEGGSEAGSEAGTEDGTEDGTIDATGDFSSTMIYLVLLVGAALVTVSVAGKKRA